MILGASAFLVAFVAPIDRYVFSGQTTIAVSLVQSAIAFGVVAALVFGLTRMKRIYLQKKLRE